MGRVPCPASIRELVKKNGTYGLSPSHQTVFRRSDRCGHGQEQIRAPDFISRIRWHVYRAAIPLAEHTPGTGDL